MAAILKAGIFMPKDEFTDKMEMDLTVHIKDYQTDEGEDYHYYYLVNDYVVIPKNYPVENIEDEVGEDIQPIDVVDSIILRNDAQRSVVKYLNNNKNGIIKAKAGFGKTVVTIKAISEMKAKSLIVVKRKLHADQWTTRFVENTNITLNDIGYGNTPFEELHDKKVVIMTVNKIYSLITNNKFKELDILNNCNFGVSIWDECQSTAAAKKFSTACLFIKSVKTFGLSATPKDKYGMESISKWVLGPTFAPNDSYNYIPKIYSIMWTSRMKFGNKKYITFDDKFSRSRYSKQLMKNDRYYDMVSSRIQQAIPKRTILCLADQYAIFDKLIPMLDLKGKKHILFKAETLTSNKKKADIKISDISKLNDYDIIFTSYQMFSDAMDVPGLDCLFMMTPNNNVEQTVGRVLRSKDDKQIPVVVDFVDCDFEELIDMGNLRSRKYNSCKWEVKTINKCNYEKSNNNEK